MNSTSLGSILPKSTISHRFTIITVMFVTVLLGLLIYTIATIQKEKSNATLIDMAGRQRMLFQKHMNEVFLTSQGVTADYTSTRELLRSTLNTLMEGGSVILDPATGKRQTIPAVPTEEILLKLRDQENHFNKIIELSDDLLLLAPNQTEFRQKLQTLRVRNSTVIAIADDAVKQLDRHTESIMATMVKWESIIALFVGLLGIYITRQGIRDGRKIEKEILVRTRAESALRDSELFLNSIVENIPDMIFVKDAKNLQFLRFNKAGEELLGRSRDSLIGKTDYDFFPQEQATFFTTKDHEVLANKNSLDIPEEIIHTNIHGSRYLHTKKIPILDNHGNPQYLLGISQDITDQKKAELERTETEKIIRRGERKFRAIYEQAPTGIATLDSLSGQFTQINQKYCDITGYSQEEMLDRTFQELTHPDDLQADMDHMQQLLAGQVTNFQIEKRYIRKNGEIIWINLTCVPLWSEPSDSRQHIAMVQDITYRKQAEKALQESEERYRILYEDNPSMYFTVAQDGTILSVNKFGAQQLGHSVEELVGQPVIDLFLEDDQSQVQQRFKDCLSRTLVLFTWEFRKVRKDKSIIWVKEVARSVYNKDGEIVVLIVCEDISARKKTEKELHDWKALTESVLGQLPKGFAYRCLNDKNWTAIYVSDGIEEVTGFPASALLSGKINYDSLLASGENERVWSNVQDALAKHLPYENEHQVVTRDGKKKWILARGRFIFDDAGQLLYLDGLNVDITEQKFIENKLRTSEARFRSLVEHVPFCIHEIDLNGKISSMNKSGQQMIGIENESQVIGHSYLKLAEEKDHVRIRDFFEQALQGQPVDFEFNETTHGKLRFFMKSFIPIRERDGTVLKIVGISEEITERKEAEKRLFDSEAKRTEALRQSDELKSALLSSVSHELRTPLTAMKGSVSSIIGNTSVSKDREREDVLKGIDREIDYMSQLVNNLLDMSQIEAGTLIPHKEWHLLEDLVEGALRRTEQTLDTRNIDIRIPENVPPVFADAVQIQQVLINLLDNAVKYSLPASPIRIQVRVEAQNIAVEASNMGEPLHPQDLERIFDRFYRRPPPRQQPIHGTGLGLAICKGIIEAHGGRIWADSIGGEVTITFTIPIMKSMPSFSLEGRHKSKLEL